VPQVARATSVTIAGCTDAVGGTDSPYNVALSELRALATEDVFVSFGMNRSNFHTVGWADTHPVPGVQGLDAATIEALNRRIVIILTEESP
jgi:outer membrane protein OmpA-like peptidoglycan-associated protein